MTHGLGNVLPGLGYASPEVHPDPAGASAVAVVTPCGTLSCQLPDASETTSVEVLSLLVTRTVTFGALAPLGPALTLPEITTVPPVRLKSFPVALPGPTATGLDQLPFRVNTA